MSNPNRAAYAAARAALDLALGGDFEAAAELADAAATLVPPAPASWMSRTTASALAGATRALAQQFRSEASLVERCDAVACKP
jgi:hypothetical protein